MPWLHNYTPLGSLWLSALAAALPFLLLCWLLVARRVKGPQAALAASLCALGLALFVWGMPPGLALGAAGYGLAFAVFPLLWVLVPAMWIYNMTVEAGQFEIVRRSISALTEDRRIQAIFIAFAFGSLLESTAGFGTPVAIGAAMLIGLGFNPLKAAAICLVANTAPVAFASMGMPVIVAGQMSGLDVFKLSALVGVQTALLAALLPAWVCVLLCGWRRALEVWPAILAAGLGSAAPMLFLSRLHGPLLPSLMSAAGSLVCLALLCRFWQPARIYRFASDAALSDNIVPGAAVQVPAQASVKSLSGPQVLLAWLPWVLLSAMAALFSLGPLGEWLSFINLEPLPWPGLDGLAWKNQPLVAAPEAIRSIYNFNFSTSAGTFIFCTGLVVPLIMPGYGYAQAGRALWRTLVQLRFSLATVALVMVLAQLLNYSGMSYSLGLALTHTGALFPLFAPILGWIGVFSTGSATSSNALFAGMQRATAEAIALDPHITVAANTAGGISAKMISPQSIAVAVAGTGLHGQEGALLRGVIRHSLIMLLIVCLLTWFL